MGHIPKSWLLLDNQSTVDMFYNKQLPTRIQKKNFHIRTHCNKGVTTTNIIVYMDVYGTVWFHTNGIVNILYMSKVMHKHRVTISGANRNELVVYNNEVLLRTFKQSMQGLYYLDTK